MFVGGLLASFLGICTPFVLGATALFSANRNYNVISTILSFAYWGQDSGGHQQRLSFYCQDDTIDIVPLAFLPNFFNVGGLPSVDFANICSGNVFQGTGLANCGFLADDIRQCQKKGKIILLSLGGAVANVGFWSDSQAESFADAIWNLFLGGWSGTRPFGNAVLDGVDLDIEEGSPAHYPAFIQRIRSLASGSNKQYFISAAPQCPFPDQHIGSALNNAHLDFVFVQFYNNYCEVSNPSQFNFDIWDQWARNTSPNPNVKIFLGAPASPDSAGQGYVDIATLSNIAQVTQKKYSSFGGVMLWDADTAYTNNKFHVAIKRAINSNALAVSPTPPSNHGPGTTTTTSTTTASTEGETPPFPDPRVIGRVRPQRPQYPKRDDTPPERRQLSRFFRF